MAPEQQKSIRKDDSAGMSLAGAAYKALYSAIEMGDLLPGTKISINALSDKLGMSRTPVRDAVSRLESDGLISYDSNAGRVIAHLDLQMVNELYTVRLVLEVAAAGMAAKNASEAEILVLKEMLEQERQLINNPISRERHNRQFHQAIYRTAHNRYLLNTLSALQTPMLLLGPSVSNDKQRVQEAYKEHKELVEYIAQHDVSGAELCM